ncbi:MAG: disulfide reductase [Euryarchaeota archaeon RBG_16_68_12]|nr:MAG: disulfide reductase [Euryarchaeota archaeon RBG_16_68_12]
MAVETPAAKPEGPPAPEEVRVGVYVCHCGLNIAGTVDCPAVARFAGTLPNVVRAVDNRYMCSDPGQEMLKKEIKEHRLNRVVVASCTPRLHEPTFRSAAEAAGLNRYLVEMANIREHCSWVHLREKEDATEKAKDLVRMAVSRASLLREQAEKTVPVRRSTLVIGGGVAGIQAALDLANAGYHVPLVERQPSIGGRMAQIDKTFPTMDCSICILAPKMSEAGRHKDIEILTNSEVAAVQGYVGNFTVTVHRTPRYVTKACTACGDCARACPVVAPNEFDMGLAARKAIYTPFAQAVPSTYSIDRNLCLNKGHVIACERCVEACQPKCIDWGQQPEDLQVEVGTIVVATGAGTFDPARLEEFGYRRLPDVITTLEFERLINAGGPTRGHLVRLSDHQEPKRVAFVQCVGSRDLRRGNPYCSNICCMETVKDALLIKEHWPDVAIDVYYMDIRAFGKGFEDLYRRAREEGVRFIRGIPGEVTPNGDGSLRLVGENTLLQERYREDYGMVILSIGLEPQADATTVQRVLTLSRSADGFFMEAHPKLQPVDTPTKGIFLAGTAESPKDIRDSVTQACAAASRANILMARGEISVEAITALVHDESCTGCGLCVKVCPYNAIRMEGEGKGRKARVIEAACAGCGTCGAECMFDAIEMRHFTDAQVYAQIDAATAEHADRKVVTFACNWCSYAGADFAGVSRMQYPPNIRIIRTMCSGRVSPRFVRYAFSRGAAAVLVSGCHLKDCHYINANSQTQRRMERLAEELKRKKIDPRRLRLEWFTAAEGQKFANTIKEMREVVVSVTTDEIQRGVAAYRGRLDGR